MNKFKKIITSITALGFLTTTAHSHYDVLGGELILEAGVHSRYVSKGVDENSNRPALSLSATFEKSLGLVDFYIGYSTITATGPNYSREDARFLGITKKIESITAEVGLSETLKKGDSPDNNNNDVDYIYKLTFQPEKAPYTVGLVYTVNDTGGTKNVETGRVKDKNYKEINASYDFKVLTASASYGEQQNDRDIKTLALSKSFMETDFTLTYSKVERKHSDSAAAKNRDFLVLSANKEF
jgi:hypothetical protein